MNIDIVVDDCSTDGTREWLLQLQKQQKAGEYDVPIQQGHSQLQIDNIRFLFQDKNQGKGAALHRGFAGATSEIALIQDADLE